MAPDVESAMAALEQIVAMPESPARTAALQSAIAAPGHLGRLTRKYLLTVEDLTREVP